MDRQAGGAVKVGQRQKETCSAESRRQQWRQQRRRQRYWQQRWTASQQTARQPQGALKRGRRTVHCHAIVRVDQFNVLHPAVAHAIHQLHPAPATLLHVLGAARQAAVGWVDQRWIDGGWAEGGQCEQAGAGKAAALPRLTLSWQLHPAALELAAPSHQVVPRIQLPLEAEGQPLNAHFLRGRGAAVEGGPIDVRRNGVRQRALQGHALQSGGSAITE